MIVDNLHDMAMRLFLLTAGSVAILAMVIPTSVSAHEPSVLVIAHRGASGYLPEHSEGSKVLAIAQGADVVEQDVVLSKDGVFIVSHDITMDATTNVREIYPARARDDGKTYWADFEWSELSKIAVRERTLGNHDSTRFPYPTDARVMRLEDEIKLIRGLNQVLKRNVGFHIELKAPAWHLKHFGSHMSDKLMEVLTSQQIDSTAERCFIQCFEAEELKYMKDVLKCKLPLVQLLGGRRPSGDEGAGAAHLLHSELAEIATYASGVGPAIPLLFKVEGDLVTTSGYVEAAHAAGLFVHPYTVRRDMLPQWCQSIDDLHRLLVVDLKVDGFFTDFPDLARAAVDSKSHTR